jgi:hypothetical protein
VISSKPFASQHHPFSTKFKALTDTVGDERIVAHVSPTAAHINADALHKHKAKHDLANSGTNAGAGAKTDAHTIEPTAATLPDVPNDGKMDTGNAQISLLSLASDTTGPQSIGTAAGNEGQYLPVLQLFGTKPVSGSDSGTAPLDNAGLPLATAETAATPEATLTLTGSQTQTLAQLDQTPAVPAPLPNATLQSATPLDSAQTPADNPTGLARAKLLAQLDQQIVPTPAGGTLPAEPLATIPAALPSANGSDAAATVIAAYGADPQLPVAPARANLLAQLDQGLTIPSSASAHAPLASKGNTVAELPPASQPAASPVVTTGSTDTSITPGSNRALKQSAGPALTAKDAGGLGATYTANNSLFTAFSAGFSVPPPPTETSAIGSTPPTLASISPAPLATGPVAESSTDSKPGSSHSVNNATLLAQLDQQPSTTSTIATSSPAAKDKVALAAADPLPAVGINSSPLAAIPTDQVSPVIKNNSGLGLAYNSDNALLTAYNAGFAVPLPVSIPAETTLPVASAVDTSAQPKGPADLGVNYSADTSLSSARAAGFTAPSTQLTEVTAASTNSVTLPVLASVGSPTPDSSSDATSGTNLGAKHGNSNATLLAQLDQQPTPGPVVTAVSGLPPVVSNDGNSDSKLVIKPGNNNAALLAQLDQQPTQSTPVYTPGALAADSTAPAPVKALPPAFNSATIVPATNASDTKLGQTYSSETAIVTAEAAGFKTAITPAKTLPVTFNSDSVVATNNAVDVKLGQTYSTDTAVASAEAAGFKTTAAAASVAQVTDSSSTINSANGTTYNGTPKETPVYSTQTASISPADRPVTADLLTKFDQTLQTSSTLASPAPSKGDYNLTQPTPVLVASDKPATGSLSVASNTKDNSSATGGQPPFRLVGPGTPSSVEQSNTADAVAVRSFRNMLAKQSISGAADAASTGLQSLLTQGKDAQVFSFSQLNQVGQIAPVGPNTTIGNAAINQPIDTKVAVSTAVGIAGHPAEGQVTVVDASKNRIGAVLVSGVDESTAGRNGAQGLVNITSIGTIGIVGNAGISTNGASIGNAGIVGNQTIVGNAAIAGNVGVVGNGVLVGTVTPPGIVPPGLVGNTGITGRLPTENTGIKTSEITSVGTGTTESGVKGVITTGILDNKGNLIPGRLPPGIVEISTDTKTPTVIITGTTTKIEFIEDGTKKSDPLILNTTPNPILGPPLIGPIKGGKASDTAQESEAQSPTVKTGFTGGGSTAGSQTGTAVVGNGTTSAGTSDPTVVPAGATTNSSATGNTAGTGKEPEPGTNTAATSATGAATSPSGKDSGKTALSELLEQFPTLTIVDQNHSTGAHSTNGATNSDSTDNRTITLTEGCATLAPLVDSLQCEPQRPDRSHSVDSADTRIEASSLKGADSDNKDNRSQGLDADMKAARTDIATLDDAEVKPRNDSNDLDNAHTITNEGTENKPHREGLREDDTLSNLVQEFEERRLYRIKKGDTLSSIALKQFGSAKYVALLIELNRDAIKMLPNGNFELVIGAHIKLPSRADITRFESTGEAASAIYLESVTEKSEDYQPKYVCRLGDDLKSVASRHPALRNARLWPLVAYINNLSDRQNKDRTPIEKLRRGQVLIIPSARQRLDYLQNMPNSTVPKPLRGSIFGNGAQCWPPRADGGTAITEGQAAGAKRPAARPWIQEASTGNATPSTDNSDTTITGGQGGCSKPSGTPYMHDGGTTCGEEDSEDLQSATTVTGALSAETNSSTSKPYIDKGENDEPRTVVTQSDTVVTATVSTSSQSVPAKPFVQESARGKSRGEE